MADLFLIEFKGHRKEYFLNKYYHDINKNDSVIIQAERGEDAGIVKQQLFAPSRGSEPEATASPLRRTLQRKANRRSVGEGGSVRRGTGLHPSP